MPDSLTWFKWEAYTTWLSGFALLVLVYYLGADLFLIDKSVLDLTVGAGGRDCLRQPGDRLARFMKGCADRRSASTRSRWRSSAMCFWSR